MPIRKSKNQKKYHVVPGEKESRVFIIERHGSNLVVTSASSSESSTDSNSFGHLMAQVAFNPQSQFETEVTSRMTMRGALCNLYMVIYSEFVIACDNTRITDTEFKKLAKKYLKIRTNLEELVLTLDSLEWK
jgi:hypothetical protein